MGINILLVGIGGGMGSILRYFLQRTLNVSFPYGTLLVNIAGCLLIGLLWGIFTRHIDEHRRLLLVTGFCGGFTTFSTFTYEGVQMLMENRWMVFLLYTFLSVVAGLAATYFGYKLTS
ncbi:MAG: fluoride efflux transporter CrcB [Flavisolibacter sp.]|nr:fluoride efflux transporter CrcB [Flavisolibacter sp.]